MLDWTLESLSKNGVDEVVLAVNYMAEALKRYFGQAKHNVKIIYSTEKQPLGTAGPVRKAEEILGHKEAFLVLNGDILCEINYLDLLKAHSRNKASATIVLHEVANPSRFGVVDIDKRSRIRRFVEKPKPGEAPSKLINAGIYAVEPTVFKFIPRGGKVSIEREVFPKLALKGELYGYRYDGLWMDIGKPNDYMQANRAILNRIAKAHPVIGKNVEIHRTAKVVCPSIIGSNAKIETEAYIGPYTSIGDGCVIKKGSRIERSIIFPQTWIDNFSSVHGAIIGDNVIIGQRVKIENTVIVGDSAIIHDNVTLTRGVTVCPSKEVDESVLEPRQVM
jgi:NDP-sugar pyrophosphorylase family protein